MGRTEGEPRQTAGSLAMSWHMASIRPSEGPDQTQRPHILHSWCTHSATFPVVPCARLAQNIEHIPAISPAHRPPG
jgi:hypothetical protein